MPMGELGMLPWQEVAVRLAAAMFAGLLLGLDREMHGKAAGLRTHTLAALSSAALTMVAFEIYWSILAREGGAGESDPNRVIQGIAQALGLVAAGVVIQGRGNRVRNLTTATTLWMAATLGIACGAGYYVIAGLTAVATLLVLIVIGGIERRWFKDAGGDEPEEDRRPPQP
ncbi:MgtC/SapB family protein [Indioceanicola profundi]|uniref:MgtC/SapB family protein n=1 Tax=Indioceanicola profundi TaxID=2220096 RepID=UPI001CEDC3FD|nr:MgtC/SapB family protein [Indioceanicola profundi]